MTDIHTIHVTLTPLEAHLLGKIHQQLSSFTDDDLQRHVVSKGLLVIGEQIPDEPDALDAIDARNAPTVEKHITIDLDERLRQRLERLLHVRPGLDRNRVFASVLDIGLETLVELEVVRPAELTPPRDTDPPAQPAELVFEQGHGFGRAFTIELREYQRKALALFHKNSATDEDAHDLVERALTRGLLAMIAETVDKENGVATSSLSGGVEGGHP